MKHFLKPLSHCLTTAVITSALLEIYFLPAVEASVPEPAQPTTAESAAEPAVAVPTPEAPLAISDREPDASPVQATDNSPQPSPAPHPAASAAPKPETAPANPEQSSPKATPAAASKPAETGPARTIAGMRQVLEKRLADLAEQNKDSRNAQWQENLIRTAIQSAWYGDFEQARRVATHPALSAAIQTDLLGKIAAIEVQWQTARLAQQLKPGQADPRVAAKPGSQTATPSAQAGGRTLPSGSFASVSPNWSSLGVSPGNQCLALQTPTSPAVAKPAQAAPRTATQTAPAKTPRGSIPAFVPALGQNLAARLAQSSQKQTTTKPSVQTQPLVSANLFTGVAASSSFRVTAEAPRLATRLATSPAQVMTEIPVRATARAPIPSAAAQAAPVATASAPALPELNSASVTPTAAESTVAENPSFLAQPLDRAEVTLTNLLPHPFNLVWNWWATPDATQAATLPSSIETANSKSIPLLTGFSADATALANAAQTGLNNYSLFQVWSQDLTQALQPPRSAFKLSIPGLAVAKTANAKTQTPTYDTAALLAMSCANAQLASQFSSYVVNPATSKQMGWVNLMFPLPIPAVVTSLFGWRIHPISGNLSFHTGLDLGAPMGTPVLAAQSGQVVAADNMGGYGLAVVVENASTRERNLYGHLSGIAVQPGTQVNQGTVLGWVGSTGNSTGPHLHFESMVHTEAGWTAIDPLASAAVTVASSGRNEGAR